MFYICNIQQELISENYFTSVILQQWRFCGKSQALSTHSYIEFSIYLVLIISDLRKLHKVKLHRQYHHGADITHIVKLTIFQIK